jgi:NADH-quinone oxidoreductase subunit F
LRRGRSWYAGFGTEKSKGTKVFALAGDVVNTGIIEVPIGKPLGDILFSIGVECGTEKNSNQRRSADRPAAA